MLGAEHADTLMTYLPAHQGVDLATRDDIARLETRFDRLEDRFDRLQDVVTEQHRFYVGVTVGSMTALTAIFSLVVRMLG
ncbi:MAG: hemolysin XhlA family protein [Actinobacteria bacterium]|nr:hemolysin XhlA family protein [Actinomycetota bacterium]